MDDMKRSIDAVRSIVFQEICKEAAWRRLRTLVHREVDEAVVALRRCGAIVRDRGNALHARLPMGDQTFCLRITDGADGRRWIEIAVLPSDAEAMAWLNNGQSDAPEAAAGVTPETGNPIF